MLRDGSTMAFEPSVGRDILVRMAKDAAKEASSGGKKGSLDIFYRSRVTAVRREGPAVRGVTADMDGRRMIIDCSVLIDATEWGDVIPLAGALYGRGTP